MKEKSEEKDNPKIGPLFSSFAGFGSNNRLKSNTFNGLCLSLAFTTSVPALVIHTHMIMPERQMLEVREGERKGRCDNVVLIYALHRNS